MQSVDAEAERWSAPTKELIAQFKSVVEELAKLPTGRTLILVSDGFSLDPKREFYAAISAYLPNHPAFKLDESAANPALKEALQIATDRNVIIDTIDSRTGAAAPLGSAGPMDAGSSGATSSGDMLGTNRSASVRSAPMQSAPNMQVASAARQDSAAMEEIAKATGGVYFRSSGDLLKQLHGALADGREYYMLAYVSKNGARDGKFRSITVETVDKKLTLRAKPGYWAPDVAQ